MDVTVDATAALGTWLVAAANASGRSDVVPLQIVGGMPKITSLSPASVKPGQTITLTINGEYLDGVMSIVFSPGAGITVSNLAASATQVTATVAVDAAVALGARTISVTAAQGASNTVTFQISNSSAPVISVSGGLLTEYVYASSSSNVVIAWNIYWGVSFTDPDANIVWNGQRDGSARLSLELTGGCSFEAFGPKLDFPAKTSGSISVPIQVTVAGTRSGNRSASLYLYDAAGNKSNPYTFLFDRVCP